MRKLVFKKITILNNSTLYNFAVLEGMHIRSKKYLTNETFAVSYLMNIREKLSWLHGNRHFQGFVISVVDYKYETSWKDICRIRKSFVTQIFFSM